MRVYAEYGDEAGLGRALALGGKLRFWAGEMAVALFEDLEAGPRGTPATPATATRRPIASNTCSRRSSTGRPPRPTGLRSWKPCVRGWRGTAGWT